MLITRTPLRISLVGGGTDMPSFYKKHPGAVVSFAINKYIYVSVNKRFENSFRVSYSKTENVESIDEIQHGLVREALRLHNIKTGLEITSIADIPGNGTGLGSSSAFTVGLVNALGRTESPATLAERAFTIEAEKCLHPVGKQDCYASAYGGMNYILFGKSKVSITPLNLSWSWKNEFETHSLLLWTGISRDANAILKEQDNGFKNGGNVEYGKELTHLANKFYQELLDSSSMGRLGEILNLSWNIKIGLAKGITSDKISELYTTALECGAYGGKLLGAGGGGFLFFLAPPERHSNIVQKMGLRKIDFKIEQEGSKVIYEY